MLSRMRTLGMINADLGRHVLPHALDAFEQVAAAFWIGQADQADADLDLHRIDTARIIFDALLRRLLGVGFGLGFVAPPRSACWRRVEHHRQSDAAAADRQQRNLRQVRENQDRQEAGRHGQRLRARKQLRNELRRQIATSPLERVTSKPAASEIKKAGTWLTRPSPIVNRVNSAAASADLHARRRRRRSPGRPRY